MNRQNAIRLRELLEQELTPILKEAGYAFELGNASFDSDRCHFKGFKVSDIGAKPETLQSLERENQLRNLRGCPVLSLDRVVSNSTNKFKLVGHKPKARKNPFIIEDVGTKKQFVISCEKAEKLFAIEEQEK